MNEAHQMHDDLLNALLPIIPRTAYQDIRRLNTLVWAIVGLSLTHTVRLDAWAEVTQGRAQYAASRVRRFSRWLHHPAISPPQWYRPALQAALVDWPLDQRLYVALDTTALTPFVLIRASLVYRGRAIPLAWRALRHRSTQVSFEAYQPVLDQVRAIIPPTMVITLLADRGFVHERLLHYLNQQRWHFRLRLPGDTLVHLSAQHVSAVKELCPPAGRDRFLHGMSILGAAVGPVHLALVALVDQPDDPWFVVSDEPTDAKTLDEYGLRFDIEESFRDEKSGGYQIHISQLATPEALERLILILAMTTLHLTSIGVGVVHAEKRRFVDPHWKRRLSYLKIGWGWQRQQDQRG
jgi:Transposase DDE domain